MTDTDRLANYLEQYRNLPVKEAGIHFSASFGIDSFHNAEYSEIARFVHRTHPDIFNHSHSAGRTIINNNLISSIRSLRENVIPGFNYY
jgi:hypothetical protein